MAVYSTLQRHAEAEGESAAGSHQAPTSVYFGGSHVHRRWGNHRPGAEVNHVAHASPETMMEHTPLPKALVEDKVQTRRSAVSK